MLNIEVLAFVTGVVLIATGIIGGGMEVKEIKIPKIAGVARVLAVFVGLLFVFLGLGYKQYHDEYEQVVVHDSRAEPRFTPTVVPEPSGGADMKAAEARGRIIQALSGQWQIRWQVGPVFHHAVLVMDGRQGKMRVTIRDNRTQEGYAVDQDIALEFEDDMTFLLGSNPVFAGTNRPDPNYSADAFGIGYVGDHVKIMLCDRQKLCGEVQFERI